MWTMIGLAFLGVVTLIILFVLWVVYYWTPRDAKRERTKPIVCICEEQGRIGVVLRKDCDAASKAEWQPYIDGTERHDPGHVSAPFGRRLKVEPVYVFKKYSKEYFTLVYYCFVERAEFYVPDIRDDDMDNINAAWQYIHGRPWSGTLITW